MYKIGKTLDLIDLCDHFRREANFEDFEAAEEIHELTNRFLNSLTYYYGEYPMDNSANRQFVEMMERLLQALNNAVVFKGVEEIILPLENIEENPTVLALNRVLADNEGNYNIRFFHRDEPYDIDLGPVLGPINPYIDSSFEHVPNTVAVSDARMADWRRQMERTQWPPQHELNL